MNLIRGWIALTYVLATLLAQGPHDHGREAEAGFLESPGGCDDSRPHVAGHEAPSLDDGPGVCASCHFRSQHAPADLVPLPIPGPGLAIPRPPEAPKALPGSPLRARCRAPPRV